MGCGECGKYVRRDKGQEVINRRVGTRDWPSEAEYLILIGKTSSMTKVGTIWKLDTTCTYKSKASHKLQAKDY